MTRQGHPRRAARVSVPNQEQALIAVDGNTVVGVLCKLSSTGGSVRLPKPLRRGTLSTMTLETATGTISAAVEFLNPVHHAAARVQPFKFIHMDPDDRRHLERALQQMLEQGLGDQQPRIFRPLAQLAQRAFGVAKKAVS